MLNKIIVLENGKKYVMLSQAIYKGSNYYTAAEVNGDETDVTGSFAILKESTENGETYVEVENDPETLEILLKYMKQPE